MQENKDMEIRKLRRSQERLKSIKEREIIRIHKHKKSGERFLIDEFNSGTNM